MDPIYNLNKCLENNQHLKLAYRLLNKTLLCVSNHRNNAYTNNSECNNINTKECSNITQEAFDFKV